MEEETVFRVEAECQGEDMIFLGPATARGPFGKEVSINLVITRKKVVVLRLLRLRFHLYFDLFRVIYSFIFGRHCNWAG